MVIFLLPSKQIQYFFVLLLLLLASQKNMAQMRQVYVDVEENNHVVKTYFYSPSEGYVAFEHWIGYTTDSGRTYTKKYITNSNVNYNNYSVNLLFGFEINGVIAFNQNTLLVYGSYDNVPSILYSTNGGNSFSYLP